MPSEKNIAQEPSEPMLSARAVAARLKCTQDYVAKLCREGKLLAELRSGVWFVREDSIDAFEEERVRAKRARAEELAQLRRSESFAYRAKQSDAVVKAPMPSSFQGTRGGGRILPHPQFLWTARKAAAALKCAPDYVSKLCREGKLSGELVDGAWFVDPGSVAAFAQERTRTKLARAEELARLRKIESSAYEKQHAHLGKKLVIAARPFMTRASAGLVLGALMLTLSVAFAGSLPRASQAPVSAAAVSQAEAPFFGTPPAFRVPYTGRALANATNFLSNVFALLFAPAQAPVAVVDEPVIPAAPAAATSSNSLPAAVQVAAAPATVIQQTNTYPVIERTVEHTVEVSGISEDELTARLNQVVNGLQAQISFLQNPGHESPLQNFYVPGVINNLSNVTEHGTTKAEDITAHSITTDSLSVSGNFSAGGSLSAATTSVSDLVIGGNSTTTGNAYIGGNVNITGVLTVNGVGLDAGTTTANVWSQLQTFGSGFLSLASSTVGDGTATGGLTVSGGATTTGNAYFARDLGIGTTSPSQALSVAGNGLLSGDLFVGGNATTSGNAYFAGGLGVGVATSAPGVLETSGNAYVGGSLTVVGDSITLGNSSSNTLTVNSSIDSSIVPNQNITYDLGSPSFFWRNVYTGTIVANSISAASSTIGGTDSQTFTINASNTTADAQDSSLIFFRGAVMPNAVESWDSTNKRFSFNQPMFIQNNSSNSGNVTTLDVRGLAGQTADVFRVASSSGANFFEIGSGGLATLSSGFISNASSTVNGGLTVLGTATTTTLAVTAIASSLLKTNSLGQLVAATAGTDYLTAADVFSYPFPNDATSTKLAFSGGLLSLASTTIGNGTATGGLTVSGNATTTGKAYFAGSVGIGTTTPVYPLSVVTGNITSGFQVSNTAATAQGLIYVDDTSHNPVQFGSFTNSNLGFFTNNASPQMSLNVNGGVSIGAYSRNFSYEAPPAEGLAVSGSVGVGTSTPWAQLSVNSNGISGPAFAIGSSTKTHFVIDNAGNVGIGTAAPSNIFDVEAQGNATAAGFINFSQIKQSFNPASASAASYRTFTAEMDYTSAQNATGENIALVGWVDHKSTATLSSVTGVEGAVSNDNVGTITTAYGLESNVWNNSTGTITNGYGLYVGSVAGTNRWAFYSAGDAPSYFGGHVGVGTTSPFATLSVHANAGDTSTTLFAIASSTASATTTLFSISNTGTTTAANGFNITNGCYAVNGTCLSSAGSLAFSYPFPSNATSTKLTFNGGLLSLASTTIGNGTQTGGLTISGGATTTGDTYLGGELGMFGQPVSGVDATFYSPSQFANAQIDIQRLDNSQSALLEFNPAGAFTSTNVQWLMGITNNTNNYSFSYWNGLGTTNVMNVTNTGNVGIGTTSPWGRLSIDASSLGAAPAFAVGSSTNTSFVVSNGGKVGIGTANPASPLTIVPRGDGANSGVSYDKLTYYDDGNFIAGLTKVNGSMGGLFARGDTSIGIYVNPTYSEDSTSDTAALTVKTDTANVGISSTSPWGRLAVVGKLGYNALTVDAKSLTDTDGLYIDGDSATMTDTGGAIVYHDVANSWSPFKVDRNGLVDIRTGGSSYSGTGGSFSSLSINTSFDTALGLVVRANSATQSASLQEWQDSSGNALAAVDAQGRLGIGTSTPTALLTVSGGSYNTSIQAISSDTIGPGVDLSNTGAGGGEYVLLSAGSDSDAGAGSFVVYHATNNTLPLVINPSDLVGIGSTTPWAQLSVNPNGVSGPAFVVGSSTNTNFIVTNSGNVGINNANPVQALDVNGNIQLDGSNGLFLNTNGALSYQTAWSGNGGNDTILLENGSGEYITFETHGTAPVTFQTNSTERMRVDSGGNVGIGTTSPSYLLTVGSTGVSGTVAQFENSTGSCYINPNNAFTGCTSDVRLKTNIASLTSTLDEVMKLNPVTYSWKSDASSTPHVGFIAQQVQQEFPDLVMQGDDGYLALNYAGFAPYLTKAIQELNVKVSDLSADATTTAEHLSASSTTSGYSAALRSGVEGLGTMIVKVTNGAVYAAAGVFDKVFAKEVHTDKLCVSDDAGETCVTRSQLDSLLNATAQSSTTPSQTTSTASTTTQTATSTSSTGDTTAPAITLIGADPAQIDTGDTYSDPGVTVSDTGSPNIGYTMSLDGATSTAPENFTLDTSAAGTHIILYSATDQAGNTGTATRTVIISDPQSSATTTSPLPSQDEAASSTTATSTSAD